MNNAILHALFYQNKSDTIYKNGDLKIFNKIKYVKKCTNTSYQVKRILLKSF